LTLETKLKNKVAILPSSNFGVILDAKTEPKAMTVTIIHGQDVQRGRSWAFDTVIPVIM